MYRIILYLNFYVEEYFYHNYKMIITYAVPIYYTA